MTPLHLVALVFLLAAVIGFVELGLLTLAFEKLGLSAHSAYLLLMTTLGGSFLNLPLFRIKAAHPGAAEVPPQFRHFLRLPMNPVPGKIIIAVNVGGCVVPVAFCLYLLKNFQVDPLSLLICIGVVSAVARSFSWPVRGVGIAIPVLIAPAAAALVAWLLGREQAAPLAYIGGTLGVLIGADLLRLPDIRRMRVPVASIGGAGSFDGIFLTGILAVLLLGL
jgi:uncharacterized membrane protein